MLAKLIRSINWVSYLIKYDLFFSLTRRSMYQKKGIGRKQFKVTRRL